MVEKCGNYFFVLRSPPDLVYWCRVCDDLVKRILGTTRFFSENARKRLERTVMKREALYSYNA